MKLIVGLGNPGIKYANTRHNIGFAVMDTFTRSKGIGWRYNPDFMASYSKASEFVVCKPSTYMNKSGESVRGVADFYKVDFKDILVVHDELDLEFGKIRLAVDGSSAGHNGVNSVIESLGITDFCRLRIGIGSPRSRSGEAGRPPAKMDPATYVLEEFDGNQKEQIPEIIKKCEVAIDSYLTSGIEATMNRYN